MLAGWRQLEFLNNIVSNRYSCL